MKVRIKSKLSIAFGIILLCFLVNVTINLISIQSSHSKITNLKNITYKENEYTSQINTSVIEVQQFLSDASATKNTDSIEEAGVYKNIFKNNFQKLSKIASGMKKSLDDINNQFNDYYDLGVKMANTYITDGTQKGNELMKDFDPIATKLSNEVDKLNADAKKEMNSHLDEIDNFMAINLRFSVFFAFLTILIAIIVVTILGKNITIPINGMYAILKDIENGQGDLTKRIKLKSNDEIGDMSHSFNNFMDNLSQMIVKIEKNSETVSSSSKKLSGNGAEVSEGMTSVDTIMLQVDRDSQNISNSINQVAENASSMAQASQVTANDVQKISEMTLEINDAASEGEKLALSAKEEMDKILKLSVDTMEINEKLGKKAGEISEIVDTIKGIAYQTNLLSLNAAIEANRSNEGDGFIVVAQEIRKLSEDNNASSETIEKLIKGINDIIKESITAVKQEGESIKTGKEIVENLYNNFITVAQGVEKIKDKVESISATVEQQSASIQEITATMEAVSTSNSEVSSEINEVSGNVQHQAELVSRLSQMATELSSAAAELNTLVSMFKVA